MQQIRIPLKKKVLIEEGLIDRTDVAFHILPKDDKIKFSLLLAEEKKHKCRFNIFS